MEPDQSKNLDAGIPLKNQWRIWLLAGVAAAGILALPFLPPLRQAQSYHHFADDRAFFGVPNFFNVVSNAGFLLVGIMGLRLIWPKQPTDAASPFAEPREKWPYTVFFVGVFATCFGSSYYHWRPNDETLMWDRLPMTVAFMSLLAATIAERVDIRLGLRLLWPLVVAGIASVLWWRWTGNLWPYAVDQYLSIVLIVLMMILFQSRYSRSRDLLWVAVFYALAKILEALDARIYAWLGWVSGHTLKHIAATVAVYWVYRMLAKRSWLTVSPCETKR
jgi:Ceramidase